MFTVTVQTVIDDLTSEMYGGVHIADRSIYIKLYNNDFKATSVIECGAHCHIHPKCVVFTYDKVLGECTGHVDGSIKLGLPYRPDFGNPGHAYVPPDLLKPCKKLRNFSPFQMLRNLCFCSNSAIVDYIVLVAQDGQPDSLAVLAPATFFVRLCFSYVGIPGQTCCQTNAISMSAWLTHYFRDGLLGVF